MRYVDLGNTKSRPVSKRKKWLWFIVIPVLLIVVGSVFIFVPGSFSFSKLLTPVSVFSRVVNPKQLSSTDGRTNILLLAVDTRGELDPRCEGDDYSGELTDSIILASLGADDKDVVLLSLPRDLWVETGYYKGKINAVYSSEGGGMAGAELLSRVVGGVTGVPVHYYAVVDFQGFEEAIDVLGGVEVDVERGFDDYRYPIPEQECAEDEDRWQHIHFDAGLQEMDGATALKFVRSRHAEGPEGNDFARSRRQQKVLLAAKRKFFSLSAFSDWAKVRDLYQTFEDSVRTDLGIWELERLYHWASGAEESLPVTMEVLDGAQGLLVATYDEERYNGAWVLVPRAGDFSEVREYVQTLFFAGGE